MQIQKRPDGRTILINDNGGPQRVRLALRESTTDSSRLKAVFVAGNTPMPIAQPHLPTQLGKRPSGMSVELRIDLN